MTIAILLMGGSGSRFGHDTPKQFHRLAGKPIYKHTLETFQNSNLFDDILLITHPDYVQETNGIPGGPTRQASSYIGLTHCPSSTSIVCIHDAVRPFVTPEILTQNIALAKKHGAVDTCLPATDTIVYGQDTISHIPNRAHCYQGQTPQTFSYPLILSAHQKAPNHSATDDCQLILAQNHPVHITPGSPDNIKITTELDLLLAEQILRLRTQSLTPQIPNLANKTYILIGGTGGIGSEIAKQLQTAGARTHILSTTSTPPVDVTNTSALKARLRAIGPVDGLINCQGFLTLSPLKSLSEPLIQKLINVNFTSIIHACRFAAVKPGGHIINFSSSAFTRGRKDYALYSASKAAIVNFTQALSLELPELHINALIPSRTDTPMRTRNFPPSTSLLSPQTVATATLSLLHSTTTGSLIEIKP